MKWPRKPQFERQTVLKGLLLLALLGNISWQPAMQSMNLSSEVKKSNPTSTSTPATEDQPTPEPTDEKQTDEEPKTAALRPTLASSMRVCNQRVLVSYSEEQADNGDLKTKVLVKPQMSQAFRAFYYTVDGGLAITVDEPKVKTDLDNQIAKIIRQRIGSSCSSHQARASAEVDTDSGELSKEEREKIKRAKRECRLNSRGKPMTEAERMTCQISRISDIDCTDERMGGQARAAYEVERRVKAARGGIKNRLMSRDEEKYNEGEELLESALDELRNVSAECYLNPMKAAKLASSLEALRAGGETYRRSIQFDEDVRATKEEMRQQMLEIDDLARQNPRDPLVQMHVQQLRAELRNRHSQMQMEIINSVNPFYNTLLSSQRTGLMPLAEFNQFAQPYQMLSRDLNSLTDPRLLLNDSVSPSMGALGGYGGQVPAQNFIQYRNGLGGTSPITPGVNPGVVRGTVFNRTNLSSPALFNQNSVRNLNSQPLPLNRTGGAGNRF